MFTLPYKGGRFLQTVVVKMSALIGIPPLHLFIQKQALDTNYRFSISGFKEIKNLTNSSLNEIQDKYDVKGYGISDHMLSKYNFTSNYEVRFPDRDEWCLEEIFLNTQNHIWFTDGSKTDSGTE